MEFLYDLIAPGLVAVIAYLGIRLELKANNENISKQIKANEENISKQIKEQINADREHRFWNIKLDSIIELDSYLAKTSDALSLGKIEEVRTKFFPIFMKISTLFKGKDFLGNFKEAFDLLAETQDGIIMPIKKYEKFGKLILVAIEGGYNELGLYE